MTCIERGSASVHTRLRWRPARFAEVPDLLRLIQRAVEHGCRHHYDPGQRRAVLLSYVRSLFVDVLGPFDTIVGLLAERPVGVAQLDPAEGRLRALFVDADLQAHGLGRALLAQIEERARRHGCSRLHGAMSLNAVPFYAGAGFRPYPGPQRLITSAVLVPVVSMEKWLPPPARLLEQPR